MRSGLPRIVNRDNSATAIPARLHITGSSISVRRGSAVEGATGGLKGFFLNMKRLFTVPLDTSRELYIRDYSRLRP